jgi:hypothetical protein
MKMNSFVIFGLALFLGTKTFAMSVPLTQSQRVDIENAINKNFDEHQWSCHTDDDIDDMTVSLVSYVMYEATYVETNLNGVGPAYVFKQVRNDSYTQLSITTKADHKSVLSALIQDYYIHQGKAQLIGTSSCKLAQ